jgi:hypothetical protein
VEVAGVDFKDLSEDFCRLIMEALSSETEVSNVSSRSTPGIRLGSVVPARCIATISVVIIGAATAKFAKILLKRLDDGTPFAESNERTEELDSAR